MTVKQLIAELQKHPEDLLVEIEDECGCSEVDNVVLTDYNIKGVENVVTILT